MVAHVRVDPASGGVTLKKLNVEVDAGTIVHPDGALAQTEGAALWGASMALHEGTEFVNGQVRDVSLNVYQPMRMADVPDMDIEFVDSDHQAGGLGDLQPPQWPRRLVTPYSMRLGRGFGSCRLPPMWLRRHGVACASAPELWGALFCEGASTLGASSLVQRQQSISSNCSASAGLFFQVSIAKRLIVSTTSGAEFARIFAHAVAAYSPAGTILFTMPALSAVRRRSLRPIA